MKTKVKVLIVATIIKIALSLAIVSLANAQIELVENDSSYVYLPMIIDNGFSIGAAPTPDCSAVACEAILGGK